MRHRFPASIHDEPLTLQDIAQLNAALLAYGWGACEMVAAGTQVHSLKASMFFKTPRQVRLFCEALAVCMARDAEYRERILTSA